MSERRLSRWDDLNARFWALVDKTETCWLWTGATNDKGYSKRIGHEGRYYRAHQLAYTLLVAPIPDDLVLDHLCRVRNCCNPAHLEPVTPLENTRRGVEARWVEDCPNGHAAGHRRTLPSGKNVCTECRRISDRQRHERHKERRRAKNRALYAARKGRAA